MAILSLWLACALIVVAEGTFAVPAMFRVTKGLLARTMNGDDVKNKKPPRFQREFTQLAHCKLLAQ